MDLPTVQVIVQSASSVLIASGVIFAGLQFRHSRSVAHVGNFTKIVELQVHLREMRVNDPELAYVYARVVEGRRYPDLTIGATP